MLGSRRVPQRGALGTAGSPRRPAGAMGSGLGKEGLTPTSEHRGPGGPVAPPAPRVPAVTSEPCPLARVSVCLEEAPLSRRTPPPSGMTPYSAASGFPPLTSPGKDLQMPRSVPRSCRRFPGIRPSQKVLSFSQAMFL